jgi:hypothetical protein
MGYVPPPFVGQQPFSLDENEPDEPFATPAADASANEPDGVFIGNLPSSATAPLLTELFLQVCLAARPDALARDPRARLMSVTVGMDSDSP